MPSTPFSVTDVLPSSSTPPLKSYTVSTFGNCSYTAVNVRPYWAFRSLICEGWYTKPSALDFQPVNFQPASGAMVGPPSGRFLSVPSFCSLTTSNEPGAAAAGSG